MRRSALLNVLLVSLLAAVALGGISFFALRSFNESSNGDVRRHYVMMMVQRVESGPYAETIQESVGRNGRRAAAADLWIVAENGSQLASNVAAPLPVAWADLVKPLGVHEFAFHYPLLRLTPDLTIVKLEAKDPAYLVLEFRRQPLLRSQFWIQVAFIFFVFGVAVSLALGMMYFYLRKKSNEARTVLQRLENGDLKARFEIKHVDEIGSLMLDFNRMAAEIERLVHRVHETEAARKDLLGELGHDIRTPLTSLKTSVETLAEHLDAMPREEQKEFISVIRTELAYFLQLIDDLFFIAQLPEPKYAKSAERIDLAVLLSDELKSRSAQKRRSDANKLRWEAGEEPVAASATILGDPLLIQRLFKNALDNAGKHADSLVRVTFESAGSEIKVAIEDDGLGISDDAIATFGQRRKQRAQVRATEQGLSLGLGSVIIKTILELHGGSFRIERKDGQAGTRLTLLLPRSGS